MVEFGVLGGDGVGESRRRWGVSGAVFSNGWGEKGRGAWKRVWYLGNARGRAKGFLCGETLRITLLIPRTESMRCGLTGAITGRTYAALEGERTICERRVKNTKRREEVG